VTPAATAPREFIDLVAALVAIDSTNPDLAAGGAGELPVARFVAAWLARAGVPATVDDFAPGRANVVAHAPGDRPASLMLNAHLDTVGVEGMVDPFVPTEVDGCLHGRGAWDTKAGLAAAMWVVRELMATTANRASVVLAAVADEECGSLGTERLIAAGQARVDGAVVLEPTNEEIVSCHKGFVWVEVAVAGRAAHGSMPDEGVDAIAKAGLVLAAIDRHGRELLDGERHPLLGPSSMHVSLISGGTEMSTYPDRCVFQLERRLRPGEPAAVAVDEVQAIVDALRAHDPNMQATVRSTFMRGPLEQPPSIPVAVALSAAYERVRAAPAVVGGAPYWTDAGLLADAGVPAVVFGPRGHGAHAADEWVDLESAWGCTRTLLDTATTFGEC
jgi:acetylornithine deacetylase